MSRGRTSRVAAQLRHPNYRRGYAESWVATRVAAQLYLMLRSQHMAPEELATRAGLTEDEVRAALTAGAPADIRIDHLAQMAAVFDVALEVRFIAFGDLLATLSPAPPLGPVPTFGRDPVFLERPQ